MCAMPNSETMVMTHTALTPFTHNHLDARKCDVFP